MFDHGVNLCTGCTTDSAGDRTDIVVNLYRYDILFRRARCSARLVTRATHSRRHAGIVTN